MNNIREKHDIDEWVFIEVANDICDNKYQLGEKIVGS